MSHYNCIGHFETLSWGESFIFQFWNTYIHLTLASMHFALFTFHFPFLPKTRIDTSSANTKFQKCSIVYLDSLYNIHSYRVMLHTSITAYNIVPNSTSVMFSFCTLCLWFVFRTFHKFSQRYIVANMWWRFVAGRHGGREGSIYMEC